MRELCVGDLHDALQCVAEAAETAAENDADPRHFSDAPSSEREDGLVEALGQRRQTAHPYSPTARATMVGTWARARSKSKQASSASLERREVTRASAVRFA